LIAGVLLGLGASACWALANVAVARAARAIGSIRALLWSQVAGAIMAAPATLALDAHQWALAPSVAGWIAVAGAASLLAYICMFYAFEHGKLTVAVPIMSSWAVLSAALSILLFDERLRGAQLVGAAAVVAGALLVARYAQAESVRGAGGGGPRWLLASAGAAVGFGVVIPAIARLVPVFGSAGAVGVVYAADVAFGLPIALALRVGLRPPHAAAWPAVVAAGLFETAGFVAIAAGSRVAPVAIVSPLASLASAFTVAYAWAVLRERPARPVLFGAALVCAGVVALAL
jgi:drug/metabolite transporter (DMT)-like permease